MALAIGTPFRFRPAQVFAGYACWGRLHQPSYHAIAKHFRRQLRRECRSTSAPGIAALSGIAVLLAIAWAHSLLGIALVWTLPLWLMLHSTICHTLWIHRITRLMTRQARHGQLDEIGVIPPGRLFIHFAICKVVLHQGDALAWMTLLRKTLAFVIFVALALPMLATWFLVEAGDSARFALLLLELALFTSFVVVEHAQSVALACLLPMTILRRLPDYLEPSIAITVCFVVLQALVYALALLIPLLAAGDGTSSLSAWSMALFLTSLPLIRELTLGLLWRVALQDSNAAGEPLFRTNAYA